MWRGKRGEILYPANVEYFGFGGGGKTWKQGKTPKRAGSPMAGSFKSRGAKCNARLKVSR